MEKNNVIRIAHIMGKMNSGGVESVVMNYYKNIDKDKFQFDFIVDEDSENVPYEEIEKLGGRIFRIPPYQKIFSYIKELKKILKENNYKIVHSHLNSLSVFPLAVAYFSKVSIRIAHSHSTSNKKEWKKNIIKNILRPFSKVFATDFWACSEHAARWLFGNKVINNGNVVIVNNAIDVNKFRFNEDVRDKLRKELNIENKFVIGHIGRFVKQKNHEFLIDIFRDVHNKNLDTVLLLIGEGPLENQIKEKVKEYKLENDVLFLGVKDNVHELVQSMDVFVFPSLYEGLGMVLIEAQAAGLPCIASNFVPNEAKQTPLLSFCDLNKSNWVNEISNMKCIDSYERNQYLSDMLNSKYNIKIQSKRFEDFYFESIDGVYRDGKNKKHS